MTTETLELDEKVLDAVAEKLAIAIKPKFSKYDTIAFRAPNGRTGMVYVDDIIHEDGDIHYILRNTLNHELVGDFEESQVVSGVSSGRPAVCSCLVHHDRVSDDKIMSF